MILNESEIEQSALELRRDLNRYQVAYEPQLVGINSKPPVWACSVWAGSVRAGHVRADLVRAGLVRAGSEPAPTPIYRANPQPIPTSTNMIMQAVSGIIPSVQADHVGAGSEPAPTPAKGIMQYSLGIMPSVWAGSTRDRNRNQFPSIRADQAWAGSEPAPTSVCCAWLEPASAPAYTFVRCAIETMPSVWAGSNRDRAKRRTYVEPAPTPANMVITDLSGKSPSVRVGSNHDCYPNQIPSVGAGSEPARTPTHIPTHMPANGQRNYVPK